VREEHACGAVCGARGRRPPPPRARQFAEIGLRGRGAPTHLPLPPTSLLPPASHDRRLLAKAGEAGEALVAKAAKKGGEAVAAASEAGKKIKAPKGEAVLTQAGVDAAAAYDKFAAAPAVPKPTKEMFAAAEAKVKSMAAGEAGKKHAGGEAVAAVAEAGKPKVLKIKGEAVAAISEAGKKAKKGGEAVAAVSEAGKIKLIKAKGEAVLTQAGVDAAAAYDKFAAAPAVPKLTKATLETALAKEAKGAGEAGEAGKMMMKHAAGEAAEAGKKH